MRDDHFHLFQKLVKRSDAAGLRRLIATGWDVNPKSHEGWRTPLLWVHGNTTMIRLLLDAGADVNPTVVSDLTPLATAAQQGHTKAVALLLRAGARVYVKPFGCSLLTYTLTGEGRSHPKIIEMLRAAGATEHHGNTHLAKYPPGLGPVE